MNIIIQLSKIHEETIKEITTVKEVWICDPNYILELFMFEKLYQTLERVFHQISKQFEVG